MRLLDEPRYFGDACRADGAPRPLPGLARPGLPPQDADEYEIAVIDLTNQLLRGTELDDPSYEVATDRLGEATVFEISTLVGYYSLLALQLRIFAP